MTKKNISDLTVPQLKKLIRETVQEAMAEVLIEFSVAAEMEAEISYRAEITDTLRAFLQDKRYGFPQYEQTADLDD